MSASFPQTSVTLVAKLKELPPGMDGAAWVRFWDQYASALRQFAAMKGGEQNAEDIVMNVLAKLVRVLRSREVVFEKGRFHSYLTRMITNEIVDQHRKAKARAGDRTVSLDAPIGGDEAASSYADFLEAPPSESSEQLDDEWHQAILKAAVEHVLTKTALSDLYRKVYRAYAMEGRDIGEVAATFNISRNFVSQIKTRIDKRIVTVGQSMLADEAGRI